MSPTGRVVITGGAGFIGSHLAERLIESDYEVICLENFLTGRRSNVDHLLPNPKFHLVECDVTRTIDLEALLGRGNVGKITHVIHLASPASPKAYAAYPIHTLKVGAIGSYNALGLARYHGARFLLSSTSEVYGDPLVSPQTEAYWGNVNPIGPRSVYDEAKRFAEAISAAYCREHGLDVRIARIFNTYGPRMQRDDGRVVSNFVNQALNGQQLTIHGDGSQTRSFCYVDDTVEGLFRLVHVDRAVSTVPAVREEDPLVVNIGNPVEMSVLQLAEMVVDHVGSNEPFIFVPLPVDDPKQRRPDISRAKGVLDWEPQVSIHDGLALTVDFFRRLTMS
jgi:dTDP-glucose 4,6-dehydratase